MTGAPFSAEVLRLIPQLKVYARSLSRSASESDDLVQETLARAWSYRETFRPGAQLKPWLFKILRSRFHSDNAQRRRIVQDVDGLFAAELTCQAEQDWRIEYGELLGALGALSHDTREAVLLVLGAGLTYDEAAKACGCPRGTIKSRVSRGRELLTRLLDPPTARPPPATFRHRGLHVAPRLAAYRPPPPSTISTEMEKR